MGVDNWVQVYLRGKYSPNQPRDEAGRFGSGGGSFSTPQIAKGPTAFLVKLELEEAKLPPAHLDGIPGIEFSEGEYIHARSASGQTLNAYGTYDTTSGIITLTSNAESGSSNVGVFGGKTILHEVGHNAHLAKLTDESADEWARISNNGKAARISSYARTNRGEHFAECYRAYARGGQHRAKLKNLEPASYKFMGSLMGTRGEKRFLPPGVRKSSAEQWERYTHET